MAAKATVDHNKIRTWVAARGGSPARVKATERGDEVGLLRIDYPGFAGEGTLEQISWDEWFKGFEQHDLAFLHDDRPEGRFSKLVFRDSVPLEDEPPPPIDVVTLIRSQHERVRALFAAADEDDSRLLELLDELSLHLTVEESVVYPMLLDTGLGEQTYQAVEEHQNVMRVIADLIEGPPDERATTARFRVLRRLVEEHLEEEERIVLPRVTRMMNRQQRQELGDAMRRFAAELTWEGSEDAALEAVLSNAEVPAPV
jgi:iron-sulfur cluster repair protein YtfE (RIC family)